MSEKANYILWVHSSFRITITGNFTPVLQLLKNMGEDVYNKKIKELCHDITSGSNLEYMGEYTDSSGNISFVFIDNPSLLIKAAEENLKRQNINGRIIKIKIAYDVKKDELICLKEGYDNGTITPMNWRKEKNEETGEDIVYKFYPYIYDVLNPIFEKNDTEENIQESDEHSCSCCDE